MPPDDPDADLRDVPRTVLLVEDDATFRNRLARGLAARGFAVTTAADGEEAIELARLDPPEAAVIDLRMPRSSGLAVVHTLHELDPTTCTVVLTGYGSVATAVEAMRLGAREYLTKPADLDQILRALGFADDATTAVRSLAEVEHDHIAQVLAACDHNVSEAARRLGMHRRSLQRKIAGRRRSAATVAAHA